MKIENVKQEIKELFTKKLPVETRDRLLSLYMGKLELLAVEEAQEKMKEEVEAYIQSVIARDPSGRAAMAMFPEMGFSEVVNGLKDEQVDIMRLDGCAFECEVKAVGKDFLLVETAESVRGARLIPFDKILGVEVSPFDDGDHSLDEGVATLDSSL